MPVTLICNGELSLLADGSPTCSTGWEQAPALIPFDLSQIDPAVATAMFGAGFALFITPWATAWGLSQLMKLLR